MILEPAGQPLQDVEAVGRIAGAEHGVGTVGVADELDLAAGFEEGGEELFALADGDAVIGLAVDDEGRGFGLGKVGEGGAEGVLLQAVPGATADLERAEGVADVGGAVEGGEIDDGGADDGGLEAVGVADRPGAHETAVGVAVDAGALGVGVGPLEDLVDDGHQVLEILATPVADDLLGEVATVGTGTAGVGEDDEETGGGKGLLDGVEAVAVPGVGTAVDIEDD